MDSRFQGSICLSIGLLGLGCYVLLGGGEPNRGSFQQASPTPVLVPLSDDTWQVTYWGNTTVQQPTTFDRRSWTVTLTGLPKDRSGCRTIIVNCDGQPLSTDDWSLENDSNLKYSFIYQQEANGKLSELLAPEEFDATSFPVELLLICRPKDFSQLGPQLQEDETLSNRVQLQKLASSRENGTVTYSVQGREASLKLLAGQRRTQLVYSKHRVQPEQLTSATSLLVNGSEIRTNLSLSWGHATQLTNEKVQAIRADLAQWRDYMTLSSEIIANATLGADDYSPSLNSTLCQKLESIEKCLDKCNASPSRECLTQFCSMPGMSYHRVQLGWETLQRLRARSNVLHWKTQTLDGAPVEQKSMMGKVTVLGFTYRRPGDALQTIDLLNQIREKFDTDKVNVVAMSTDHELAASQFVKQALNSNIPVLQGKKVAEDLQLFRCGVPVILLQRPDGSLHAVYACQSTSLDGWLIEQVEQLLNHDTNLLTLTPEVNGASFTSRFVDSFNDLNTDAPLVSVN